MDFTFKDPYKKQDLVFKIVNIENLEVIDIQRKPSKPHVEALINSILRVGFITPLIVIESNESKDKYLVVDGQHRLLAAKSLGINELPVIVVPQALRDLMMNFNIEKELNIREKAYVALNVYREYMKENINESNPIIIDSIEAPYLITLGIAYEKEERLAGSSLATILKKCDGLINDTLKEAYKERERRANIVISANAKIRSIVEKLKENNLWNPFVYSEIVSYANPYKRKRKVSVEFDEAMNQFMNKLDELEKNPSLLINEN